MNTRARLLSALLSSALAVGASACEPTPNEGEGEGSGASSGEGRPDLDCPLGDLAPEGEAVGELSVFGRVVTYRYTIEDEQLSTVTDEQGRRDRCSLVVDEATGGATCEDQYRCSGCDVLLQQSEDGRWFITSVGFQAGCERYGGALELTPDM